MSKIAAQVGSDGNAVVMVSDVIRLLDAYKEIAYWSTGEQVLKHIRSEMEKAVPARQDATVSA